MMWSLWAALAVLLWWAFLSRARWSDRLGAVALMIAGSAATWQFRDESMGPLWLVGYLVPGLCLALVAGAAASRSLPYGPWRATMAAIILLGSGVWLLVRTEGINGDHVADFEWRWAKSPEERLLAAPAVREPEASPPAPSAETPRKQQPAAMEPPREDLVTQAARKEAAAISTDPVTTTTMRDWPGFRGSKRDGIVTGVRVETDWVKSPPVEIWRRPIGPGWSSFAVRGDLLYTQEQRGDDEVVACYRASTGEPVWAHRDRARFFESNAGAGPRATPTLSNGRVYTFGATGILNALDATDGALLWSRDAAADSEGTASMGGGKTKVPDWGFAGSPCVVDDAVIVAVAGQLVAYDIRTGRPRWFGPAGGVSYSSPHPATINGVPQVLLTSAAGITAVASADGKRLWEHPWRGFPIVQPALVAEGEILMVASGESGTRRIAAAVGPDGWKTAERWTSKGLKPYFNDFVVHEDHAFGFDGRILACLDVKDGTRKWKGGRYGNGQLLLLADQGILLVLSEEGEVALVRATPDQFTEIARFKAIEGKTWNHPVVAGDLLLVRNGNEMAAFRLSLVDR
jgi:outer membrane protein assembly factor BamB